ncbi:hypothetical protein BDK51DRAFT_52515 [Blyttiomyces helicus]|uniref:Uncharacterized protein n=1 Tax=Blyttiomyces helicus TaxID=388810 RepID=A0A4P9WJ06_9FUNG|nr:hypothetical protein BDK51DRAFT_52515 [Blyttiomyces helicus]|eukprot:RKO91903.1 hypothetical protein BDK51DRAFT_52515 [Blyttiomyces helicus]
MTDLYDYYAADPSLNAHTGVSELYGYRLVHVDGSCLENGAPNARAAMGLFYGHDNPLNAAVPYLLANPTNNASEDAPKIASGRRFNAEAWAFYDTALQQLRDIGIEMILLKVKGHDTTLENQEADRLARQDLIANHLKLHIHNVNPLLAMTTTEVDKSKLCEPVSDNALPGSLSSVTKLADNTNIFRRIDVMSLSIYNRDASTFKEITDEVVCHERVVPEGVFVGDVDAMTIQSLANNLIPVQNMSMESKPLIEQTELLRVPSYDAIRPMFHFAVGGTKTVWCGPGFAIFNASAATMMIDTDKHMMNQNFNTPGRPYNKIVRGVRVIGMKFAFYKATFSEEYMMQLGDGFPYAKVLIFHYPSSNNSQSHFGMDYSNPLDRKIIVSMMLAVQYVVSK